MAELGGAATTAAAGRPRVNPARQASLREHNLGMVLAEIAHSPNPPSRADIAQLTGLTRTTVSALADQLIAAGLAAELPIVYSRKAGRPAAPLVIAGSTLAAVGLEVNVDYLGVRVLDLAGDVLAELVTEGNYRQTRPTVVVGELAAMWSPIADSLAGLPIAGVCVALPGLVHNGTGPLRLAPNLHWQDVDVAALLQARMQLGDIPIALANEANLAAQAEAAALRHSDIHSFFYVSGEIGIGGAIVRSGEIAAGSHGWSGEIGHTLIDPGGPVCGCGATGCLEQYAGKDALLRGAGLELIRPVGELAVLAAAGSGSALESLDRAGSALGMALANAINLIDVDTVVLGGIYAPLIDYLLPGIVEQLRARVLWQAWAPIWVQAAQAQGHAALTGAALKVVGRVLADPSGWISHQSLR